MSTPRSWRTLVRALGVTCLVITIGSLVLDGQTAAPQGQGRGAGRGAGAPAPARGTPATEVYKLEEAYLDWPVAAADRSTPRSTANVCTTT